MLHLQSELPSRASSTPPLSATELHNLQYLSRLGLWGRGLLQLLLGLRDDMQLGGASAKELLPVHLKACGSTVSRLISYDGVRVRVATHQLTAEQAAMYDAATAAWQQLACLLRQRSATGQLPSNAASRFWSAHQRFFRCLVTAAKLPLHTLLSEGLAESKSIVIGLLARAGVWWRRRGVAAGGGGDKGAAAEGCRWPSRRLGVGFRAAPPHRRRSCAQYHVCDPAARAAVVAGAAALARARRLAQAAFQPSR